MSGNTCLSCDDPIHLGIFNDLHPLETIGIPEADAAVYSD